MREGRGRGATVCGIWESWHWQMKRRRPVGELSDGSWHDGMGSVGDGRGVETWRGSVVARQGAWRLPEMKGPGGQGRGDESARRVLTAGRDAVARLSTCGDAAIPATEKVSTD